MNLEVLVTKYIAARDKKQAIMDEAKQKAAKIDAVLEKIEGVILQAFNETGAESVKTAMGTAYKTTRTSVTVADWDAALNFIREGEHWEMLERRVSKKAVEEFKEETGGFPPGLSTRVEIGINVRRT